MEKPWLSHYPAGVPAEIDISGYKNLLSVVDESVQKYGDRVAFIHRVKHYEQTYTYKQLDARSRHFAAYLQGVCGLQKGDRIAIQMPNLLQYPVVMIGALRAGLVVVNTNPLYTPREMQHQFIDSGAKALVILDMFGDKLPEVLPCTDIETVIVSGVGDGHLGKQGRLINFAAKHMLGRVPKFELHQPITRLSQAMHAGAMLNFHPVDMSLEDTAFLQYTGGTTGVSKGAILTHGNIVANVEQMYQWLRVSVRDGQETIVTPLPLYHIFALTCNCFAFMKFGGKNLLISNPRDLPEMLGTLAQYDFTVLTGVNTLYNAIMNHPDFGKVNWKNLRLAVGGAMALQTAVVERWQQLTNSPLIEGYGLTESSPVVTINRIDGQDRKGTIGIPIPSTEVRLVDENDNILTAPGERGELQVRGPQVMAGYHNQPAETARALKDGWLSTGDIATWTDEHFLKIVDRKKDMVLVSGFNVYPNEVEDVLAKHPGVLEVACIGVPDAASGEAVKVVIVPRDPNLTEESVRDFANEQLTGYKKPKHIEFRTTELPKSNVGKILRRALRDEVLAKHPAGH